jgi:DNA-binding NarL/FixJ family response regulator
VESVLIVDDHEAFRAAARGLLELEGYAVAGEAETGEEAVQMALALAPDVVLLDVSLPDITGFEVAERLADAGSSATIVLVSSQDPDDVARRTKSCSARTFISKDDLFEPGLRKALEGTP